VGIEILLLNDQYFSDQGRISPMMIRSRQIRLDKLLNTVSYESHSNQGEINITGISLDSRQVQAGHLFIAMVGDHRDGHSYIPDAIRNGAVAVVGTQSLSNLPVPYFQVENGRLALAQLSAAFYDHPSHHMVVIGVTGTDGKTTTSNLIFHILQAAGLRAGMISTISAQIDDHSLDTGFHVTTPEAPDVQRYLYEMLENGLTHVVLEATSHGLAQDRVAACDFDIGVITNITHEHLDYHGSFRAYQEAKAKLFRALAKTDSKDHHLEPTAILNHDDESYRLLEKVSQVRRVSYGLSLEADVQARNISNEPDGVSFTAVGKDYQIPIKSHLVGSYNTANCLAAIAATVEGLHLEPQTAQQGIASLQWIPGRMEKIDLGQPFLTFVDFAHTPNALKQALTSVHQLTVGRVIAVFGSAGLRDRAKRRMMAEVSIQLADLSLLTAEDPRTESLKTILAEMAAGAVSQGGVEGETFWRIPDRREAIRFALSLARPGDVVIICGKGHEQSMCFGEVEYPWDDRIAVRAALTEWLSIPGPGMPYLPPVK
jgi:UDP-N-acetylmuramoyl-L-alanyl-D-glutamate--2,6-diaminopimelate ligase